MSPVSFFEEELTCANLCGTVWNMNRPTETGLGADVRNISPRIRQREANQWAERLAEEARQAAAVDAAVTVYVAQKEARDVEALRALSAAK